MNRIIGKVSEEERDEIQSLFERKNGLRELAKILTVDNDELYEKLVKDLSATETLYQSWWDRVATKYRWERVSGGSWRIDFNTCEISLV
ncbi:MAG: CXXX repeat peptide modification system protein [Bacteroidales bacterium]|nr:CXXX repeat peptide modification system protein [Bacteroidales bacterium]